MSVQSKSTDLVKFNEKKPKLPVKFDSNKVAQALELVDSDLVLKNREEVKKYLPDILGRALARSWIDTDYKKALSFDVKSTLAKGGVVMPDEYECQYEASSGQRAKIVVYEKTSSNFKVRVCGLSLTMVASR